MKKLKNKWKKGLAALAAAGLMLGAVPALDGVPGFAAAKAEAASYLDTYRNLLVKGRFTLRYIDVTPIPKQTNKDARFAYDPRGMNYLDTDGAAFLENVQAETIVVSDGANRYEEIANNAQENAEYAAMRAAARSFGVFGSVRGSSAAEAVPRAVVCRLTLGDDAYSFTSIEENGQKTYYGLVKGKSKKNQVSALPLNYHALFSQGVSYGGPNMTRYLSAILPDWERPEGQPGLAFASSGWLPDGRYYEDYRVANAEAFEIVRYYFKNYALDQIKAAVYKQQPDGSYAGSKTILNVLEFSPTPDKGYLKLPEGVVDKTKREEDAERQGSIQEVVVES